MSQAPVTAEGPVVGMQRGRSTTQWGVIALMISEGMLFLLLFVVYLYYRGQPGPWPPEGLPLPELSTSLVRTAVLLGSSIPVMLAERALERHGRTRRAALWWLVALAMAGWFLYGHVVEQQKLITELVPQQEVYGSIVLTILNFHAVHLAVGLAIGLFVVVHLLTGRITARRPAVLQVGSWYWHYVDAIWVVVYGLLYVSPHLLGRA